MVIAPLHLPTLDTMVPAFRLEQGLLRAALLDRDDVLGVYLD